MNVTVLGSGAWGTALALLLLENGNDVTLWSYFQEESDRLRAEHENPMLPGVPLPEELRLTADISCVRDSDVVVLATPSFAVRSTARQLAPLVKDGTILVSVGKGIEKDTALRLSQVIAEEVGERCPIVVLCGPTHAEEVGRKIPSAIVAASESRVAAHMVQELFMNPRFRVYASPDVIGVEIGAALKNVIALCTGVIDGMGYGDNTRAMLMTRGLTEIARLGTALGGKQSTFAGLTGVGDLIVTCTSMNSRNHRAGILVGKGMRIEDAIKEMGGAVVEGYYAAASGMDLARKAGVEMPITQAAYQVLYEGREIEPVFYELMTRQKKDEIEDTWL
ncbi:MAG TPA: NAD(P)-dependent glycerol-3-phosphate dehydrogenase [Candidatus Onthomonas avicola]|nr:NAD(P)-dependent glycerol-3-phosphate dehydrogenase [Candidatus Onthomonas avicola]